MSSRMSKLKEVKVNDISQRDTIIALMGPTGAGKSTFITTATEHIGYRGRNPVGHKLESYTAEIHAVRFPHPKDNQRSVVLVDTPGFDDTNKSDTKILKMIADWLEKTYKSKIKLTGIVYVHRITDNRMAGTPLKNLHMFANLCGDSAIKNVILATTMWSERVIAEIGPQREAELISKFWKPMLDHGSRTERFLRSYESAWNIIDSIIYSKVPAQILLLQEELVDLHKRLSETRAGMILYQELQRLLADQKEAVRKLREEAGKHNDPQLSKELDIQLNEIQEGLRSILDQVQEMKIPLGRRLLLLFSFKRPSAHALKTK